MTHHVSPEAAIDLDVVWGPMRLDKPSASLSSEALQADLDGCTAEVLASHGIRVARDRRVGDLGIASVIGFTGEGLAGALGLATTDPTLATLYARSMGSPGDLAAHSDWLRELSNQVLGRLKGRLLTKGYAIHLAIPQSVRGMSLVPNESRRSHIAWTVLTSPAGVVLAWLDLETSDAMAAEAGPSVAPSESGDVIIF
ncbi:MAG: chemotaxis protein CheX [Oligoflexia bacterium]|nr:chemotaxis protein CheX [Oligoflexia bacterium]